MRRHASWQPWPLHLGQHPARMLSEQHPSPSIRWATSSRSIRPAAARCSAASSILLFRTGDSLPQPFFRRCAASLIQQARHRALHGSRGCIELRRLELGEGLSGISALAAPIISCAPASARCSSIGSPRKRSTRRSEIADRRTCRTLPQRIRSLLQRSGPPRLA